MSVSNAAPSRQAPSAAPQNGPLPPLVAQTFTGGEGDDVLTGTTGDDVLDGGNGIDTADYSAASSRVTAQLNDAIRANDGDGGRDTLISIENLTGSAFNDLLIGSSGANVLNGGLGADCLLGLAGDDVLIGGAGASNQMQGGLGDDIYVVTANDTLVELAGEGTDTVRTDRAIYVLKTHFENLTYTGGGAFRGTGNAANNILTGGVADDVLAGRGGNDTLDGAGGIDTADYAAAAGGVTASLATGAVSADGDGGADTLVDIENLAGSGFADRLTGGAGVNLLTGGAGDDILAGGGGNDTLDGGLGLDTADYSTAVGGVDVRLAALAARNDGTGGVDVLRSIENVTGSDFNDVLLGDGAANVLAGGLGADTLIGNAGDDSLRGGTGAANTMQGGLGNDHYFVQANDTLVEFAGEGMDRVETDRASFTLGANLENLDYSGSGDFRGTGNGLNNNIYGGLGADVLTGLGGDDYLFGGDGAANLLIGGTGDDFYWVTAADVIVEEVGGGDLDRVLTDEAVFTLSANIEFLQYYGGAGGTVSFHGTGNATANRLVGGDAGDVLMGMGGDDTIYGGQGGGGLFGGGPYLGDGDDTMIGGEGNDRLINQFGSDRLEGGIGDDFFEVYVSGTTVIELAGEGTDTIRTSMTSWTLEAAVENLTFGGGDGFSSTSQSVTGVGNALANIIRGSDGGDFLTGGGGDDQLFGNVGTDTVYMSGLRSEYTMDTTTTTTGVFHITDTVAGRDGADTLTYVERIVFSDGEVYVTPAPTAPVIPGGGGPGGPGGPGFPGFPGGFGAPEPGPGKDAGGPSVLPELSDDFISLGDVLVSRRAVVLDHGLAAGEDAAAPDHWMLTLAQDDFIAGPVEAVPSFHGLDHWA